MIPPRFDQMMSASDTAPPASHDRIGKHPPDPRFRLRTANFTAVSLVALFSIVSFLLVEHQLARQQLHYEFVNLAGRQRMFSQALAMDAFELIAFHDIAVDGGEAGKEAAVQSRKLRKRLLNRVNAMRAQHTALADPRFEEVLTPALKAFYFGSSGRVHDRVHAFLAEMERIAGLSHTELSAAHGSGLMSRIGEQSRELLKHLELAVSRFMTHIETKGAHLELTLALLLAAMLLLLASLWFAVLRPAENRLARQHATIALFNAITTAANEIDEVDDVLQVLVDALCNFSEWSVGHVYFVGEDGMLEPSSVWYLDDPQRFRLFREVTERTTFTRGIGLPGRILENARPAWIEDVYTDPNFLRVREAEDIGVHAAFGFPIFNGSRIAAVAEFFSPRVIPRNQELLETVSYLGVQVGRVLERREAIKALRAAEERNHLILDSAGEGIFGLDKNGRTMFVNAAACEILGYAIEELLGERMHAMVHHTRADGSPYPFEEHPTHAASQDGEVRHSADEVFWRKDGTSFPVDYHSTPIQKDGTLAGTVVVFSDVTERRALEAQLQQAQKMEAVGQLTGGIAPDFNNLLAVILGTLELLERGIREDPRLQKRLKTAIGATLRGADLTQRLLAFSRRQALEPEVVDINELVDGMHELLHRTLGEAVELQTTLVEDLGPTLVDPAQLESALLNLAINARDAMPKGGKLTIETARVRLDEAYTANYPYVTPGQYVMAAVTDTGTGMPPEVVDKVFDPFFTTKEVGKGTGLGLSMVYGFVKQSRGHVHVYSEEGHGTTVKIYLPERGEVGCESRKRMVSETAEKGTETILVVEDDADVREVAVDYLEGLGYGVLEAGSGPAALELIARMPEDRRIDLLFSDVVMPGGMTGPELAEKVCERYPGIKVLFASGYPRNAFERLGLEKFDAPLMTKPYHNKVLAENVRRILES